MKLTDFYSNGPLNDIRVKMGAALVSDISLSAKLFSPLTVDELEQLSSGGLERYFADCKVEEDLTLSYKGKRVIVYIHDRHQYQDDWDLPKFHIASCKTLKDQSKKDAYNQKYVISQRDDGYFSLRLFKNRVMENIFKQLNVCQNCLDVLKWQNFDTLRREKTKKLEIVTNFSLVNFYEKFPKDVLTTLPKYTSANVPINDYPSDWSEIRKRILLKRNQSCEDCGASEGLEVHHKNGVRSNNDDYNLELLCHKCHQKHHAHYK